jgi:hypothetical protein
MDTATPAHLPLSEVQAATKDLRRLLRDLGAEGDFLGRIVPRHDIEGRAYVHAPPLPVALVQHLVRLLPEASR